MWVDVELCHQHTLTVNEQHLTITCSVVAFMCAENVLQRSGEREECDPGQGYGEEANLVILFLFGMELAYIN